MSAARATLALLLAASGGATAASGGPGGDSSPVPAESRQMLLATSAGWDATRTLVQAYERRAAGAPWAPVGPAVEAALGRAGLAWGRGRNAAVADGPQKREGDGRSPAGVFDLPARHGLRRGAASGHAPAGTGGRARPCAASTTRARAPTATSSTRRPSRRTRSSAEDMRRPDEL